MQAGERVLDVGNGRGAVLFPAAEAVGPAGEVVGIDITPGMVRHLGDEITRRGIANASTVEMDRKDPKFAPRASI